MTDTNHDSNFVPAPAPVQNADGSTTIGHIQLSEVEGLRAQVFALATQLGNIQEVAELPFFKTFGRDVLEGNAVPIAVTLDDVIAAMKRTGEYSTHHSAHNFTDEMTELLATFDPQRKDISIEEQLDDIVKDWLSENGYKEVVVKIPVLTYQTVSFKCKGKKTEEELLEIATAIKDHTSHMHDDVIDEDYDEDGDSGEIPETYDDAYVSIEVDGVTFKRGKNVCTY